MSDDQEYSSEQGSTEQPSFSRVPATSVRKNMYLMIKGHCCKVVETSSSKPGKHGHAKVHLTGIDIFTGKKYEDICPGSHDMAVPDVLRTDYTVIGYSSPHLSLLDKQGNTRTIELNDNDDEHKNIIQQINKLEDECKSITVNVTSALGLDKVNAVREATSTELADH